MVALISVSPHQHFALGSDLFGCRLSSQQQWTSNSLSHLFFSSHCECVCVCECVSSPASQRVHVPVLVFRQSGLVQTNGWIQQLLSGTEMWQMMSLLLLYWLAEAALIIISAAPKLPGYQTLVLFFSHLSNRLPAVASYLAAKQKSGVDCLFLLCIKSLKKQPFPWVVPLCADGVGWSCIRKCCRHSLHRCPPLAFLA